MMSKKSVQHQAVSPSRWVWSQLVSGYFVVVFVFVIGLLGTIIGYVHVTHVWKDGWEAELHRDALETRDQIQERLMSYQLGLDFGRWFVDSSSYVSRDKWRKFYNTQSVEQYFPGVMGFGYVEVVESDDVDDFVTQMQLYGVSDFSVKTHPGFDEELVEQSDSWQRYLIKYHEPESRNREAWGLDVASNPENREVYDCARDLGEWCVSKPFKLYQGGDEAWGIVFATPVYEKGALIDTIDQRREAIVGWVMSSVEFDRFMAAEWNEDWNRFDIELSSLNPPADDEQTDSGVNGQVLYASVKRGEYCDATEDMQLSVGDLSLGVRLTPWVVPNKWFASPKQAVIFVVGFMSTLLFTLIVWSVSRTRCKAQQIAQAMTKSLRESELCQRQLTLEAESANQSKSDFLANMSHEIRTPMTAILGFSEILEENITRETRSVCVDAIHAIRRSGKHLMVVINDVLDLSKVESGKLTVHMESSRVVDTVEDVYKAMMVEASRAGLGFDVEFLTDVPEWIETDAYRVRQVLINLIGNAVKYTPTGSVTIQLSADDQHVCIAVKDTGEGIADSELKSLFMPFVQLGNEAAHRQDSSGLGLAIAHRLACLLGGRLDVESVLGHGSTFTLLLPFDSSESCTMVRSFVGMGPGLVSDDPGCEHLFGECKPALGRILLAEDGVDNQKLIVHMLKGFGLGVEVVEDGQQAVDLLSREHDFVLVLMDMQMPVLDGYQATRRLREIGCALPIVALTAHAMAGARKECIDAGCDDYVAKPINRSRLHTTIRRLIDAHCPEQDDHQHAA